MKLALEKYGIRLPSFGKIGGILANEVINTPCCWCFVWHVGNTLFLFLQLSVDEAAGIAT